jgi:NAD+ synthase (glutamine-hydrolysing)
MAFCVLATCNLNQWALDFDGNLNRTRESIRQAKAHGAKYRLGPELELSGYGCEDHFLEQDTYMHCDESLAILLDSDLTEGILCDIGMPVLHLGVRYNCRIFCLDRKIVLIRPKMYLADDGNYRECRFFSAWKDHSSLHCHRLSEVLAQATGQETVPIGIAAVRTADTLLASESCEELWTPNSPHIEQALAGVEIFTNGSGSHHSLRKLDSRVDLMRGATAKCGGAYLYANHRGCDGGRLYFDGSSLACVNGDVVAQAEQFSLRDVEVLSVVIDLTEVRAFRQGINSLQCNSAEAQARASALAEISVAPFTLGVGGRRDSETTAAHAARLRLGPSPPQVLRKSSPEEECALGPACWLWDYLRRSKAGGFLLPLSGGADSASVCAIVYVMCRFAVSTAYECGGDAQVAADIRRLMDLGAGGSNSSSSGTDDADPEAGIVDGQPSAEELCRAVLHTCYMSTSNSSENTRGRAERLAVSVGAFHSQINIDTIVSTVLAVFSTIVSRVPRFSSQGGSAIEDLALQNIQVCIAQGCFGTLRDASAPFCRFLSIDCFALLA